MRGDVSFSRRHRCVCACVIVCVCVCVCVPPRQGAGVCGPQENAAGADGAYSEPSISLQTNPSWIALFLSSVFPPLFSLCPTTDDGAHYRVHKKGRFAVQVGKCLSYNSIQPATHARTESNHIARTLECSCGQALRHLTGCRSWCSCWERCRSAAQVPRMRSTSCPRGGPRSRRWEARA